ncbi:unnamed protein product [Moneuplotes crassus]|uniref:mevalonate kinase n=1 Tax=Euplotes crassus TaxID=5936 RepID=A0AAD1UPK2_EUPCR|nr:unnamed protein product [Moneuplotes crassus]
MESDQQVLAAKFSAPSKIILSGEHSVVYGHPAIAFAVGQSCEDHEEGKEIDKNIAYRTQSSIIVYHKTDTERPFLKWKSTIFETIYNEYSDLSSLEKRKDLEKLGAQIFLEAVKKGCDNNQDIINEIVSKYTFDVTFGFGVPIGAGLGSSGSFNCAATGSIYMIFKTLCQKELPSEITVTREDLEKVKDLTHFGEKLVHGNPSGIDSYIISEGGIVKFTKTDGEIHCENDFDIPADLNFDIVFTGVNRSTKTSLVNMLNLKNAFPGILIVA